MTTTPVICSEGGTLVASTFVIGGILVVNSVASHLIILEFTLTTNPTTYWVNSSELYSETILHLVHPSTPTGAPLIVYVVAHIDGTLGALPLTLGALPDRWWLHSLDTWDYFVHPLAPITGTTQGVLAGKHTITTASGTTDISINMAALIPAITNQSWTGKVYLNLWVDPKPTAYNMEITRASCTLALPSDTMSAPNRDTGRSGSAEVGSPYGRDPISGFASLQSTWVEDGYRKGLKVDPRSWDPPEPPSRPTRPERGPL